jgi:hypothetical protein
VRLWQASSNLGLTVRTEIAGRESTSKPVCSSAYEASNERNAQSDESGTSRDESGLSRDESGAGWDESAAHLYSAALEKR